MSKIDELRTKNPFFMPQSKRANKVVIHLPNKKCLRRKVYRTEDQTPFIVIRKQRLLVMQEGERWDVIGPMTGYDWPSNIAELGW